MRKYCRLCGKRMGREAESRGYDGRTGKKRWQWWWACPTRFFGYEDDNPRHDGRRIRTSPARRRLEG